MERFIRSTHWIGSAWCAPGSFCPRTCLRLSAARKALQQCQLRRDAGRGSRTSRQERLGQVDAGQDPRRLPRARSRVASCISTAKPSICRSNPATTAGSACPSCTRTWASCRRSPCSRTSASCSSPAARRASSTGAEEKRPRGAHLARFGLDLDPHERVDKITPVQRALLAIVRAFEEIEPRAPRRGRPGLVLLDEPTPFLPASGVEKLFALVRSITASGSSVIFISHDIDEVMQITDRITRAARRRSGRRIARRDATHAKDRRDDRRPHGSSRRRVRASSAASDRSLPRVTESLRQDARASRRSARAARRDPGPDRPDRLGLRGNSLSVIRRTHRALGRDRLRRASGPCRKPK